MNLNSKVEVKYVNIYTLYVVKVPYYCTCHEPYEQKLCKKSKFLIPTSVKITVYYQTYYLVQPRGSSAYSCVGWYLGYRWNGSL